MMFDGLGSPPQHIKGGRIKALMVAGTKRNPAFPDVPCAAEVGLPDYTVTTWYGLWAPKGTPADVQARIVDEMRKAAATDELKAIWASNGAEIRQPHAPAVRQLRERRIKRWAAVVKASGAKLE
jgi:tripartite-type tricarboxylate transporter receptor subunit TctC